MKNNKLEIVYFGLNDSVFSHKPLKALLECGHLIRAVVTPKDDVKKSLAGKARQLVGRFSGSNLNSFANSHGIDFYNTDLTDKNFIKKLGDYKPDLIVVSSLNQLLKKEIIVIPRLGCINLHPSFLPHYRGRNPWFWMAKNSEKEWGATIHYIDEGEDTGNIILQGKYAVEFSESLAQIRQKALSLGIKLLVDSIEKIKAGDKGRPQEKTGFVRAPKPRDEDALLNLEKDNTENQFFVKIALNFLEPSTNLGGRVVKIAGSKLLAEKTTEKNVYETRFHVYVKKKNQPTLRLTKANRLSRTLLLARKVAVKLFRCHSRIFK